MKQAHANAIENLVIFGALVLAAHFRVRTMKLLRLLALYISGLGVYTF